MADWRKQYLTRLTAERSALVWKLVLVDEATLTDQPIFENYTAKDLIAHIGAWDALMAEWVDLAASGREKEIEGIELHKRNARQKQEHADWTLDQAVDLFMAARASFSKSVAEVTDEELHRPINLPGGISGSISNIAKRRYKHDAIHAADLAKWREIVKFPWQAGPKSVLMAAMASGREELLATMALVPDAERESRPVCGVWTLKDVLGHIADWEWYGVEGLRPGSSCRSLTLAYEGSVQDWNEAHAAARHDHSWDHVWSDLQSAREALQDIVTGLNQDDLGQPYPAPWYKDGMVYSWISLWLWHERFHAADMRKELQPKGVPERLMRV